MNLSTIINFYFALFSRLEQRRENVRKGEVDLDIELAEADERRKVMEAERIKKLAELSGLDKIEKVAILSINLCQLTLITSLGSISTDCQRAVKARSGNATAKRKVRVDEVRRQIQV